MPAGELGKLKSSAKPAASAEPGAQCHDEYVPRSHGRSASPVAITSAAPSLDDQHDARRRKYLIMMGLRIVCVIAAASVFRASILLALALMVGGAVLPWCAVLIANDRPARNRAAFLGYRPSAATHQLPRQSQAAPSGSDIPPRTDVGRPARAVPIEWLDPDDTV